MVRPGVARGLHGVGGERSCINVWSGRASQEVFMELAVNGLASMYGPAVRRKRSSWSWRRTVLHQCMVRPSAARGLTAGEDIRRFLYLWRWRVALQVYQ